MTEWHLFNDLFSWKTMVNWHQKSESILDFNEARHDEVAVASAARHVCTVSFHLPKPSEDSPLQPLLSSCQAREEIPLLQLFLLLLLLLLPYAYFCRSMQTDTTPASQHSLSHVEFCPLHSLLLGVDTCRSLWAGNVVSGRHYCRWVDVLKSVVMMVLPHQPDAQSPTRLHSSSSSVHSQFTHHCSTDVAVDWTRFTLTELLVNLTQSLVLAVAVSIGTLQKFSDWLIESVRI